MNKQIIDAQAIELRRRAEARVKLNVGRKNAIPGAEAAQRLLHELQVHQIELEMQNEELRQSRAKTEASLARFTEFFDFAPIGYLTLQCDGAIHEINLAGASLVGMERAKLIGMRFIGFVAAESRSSFDAFLKEVFVGHAKATCDVTLMAADKRPLFVRIEAMADTSGKICRVSLMDITERKLMEEQLRRLTSHDAASLFPAV